MPELTKEEMDKALEQFFQEGMYIMRQIYLMAYEAGLKENGEILPGGEKK